jgi:hypothetical protein
MCECTRFVLRGPVFVRNGQFGWVFSAVLCVFAGLKQKSARSSAVSDDICKNQYEIRHCLLQALPVFEEHCETWAGAANDDHGRPVLNSCQLRPQSHWEAMTLLNNSVVLFIGDSTARRAGIQLGTFLTNTSFADVMKDGEAYHSTVARTIDDPVSGFTGSVMSMWFPHVKDLHKVLDSTNPETFDWPPRYSMSAAAHAGMKKESWKSLRKMIVLHYSTWDVRHFMNAKRATAGFSEAIATLSDSISLLKQQPYIDTDRDIIMLRLPIAQGCEFEVRKGLDNNLTVSGTQQKWHPSTSGSPFECDSDKNRDPINELVKGFGSEMRKMMVANHPDVGLIDVFSWTKAADGVGRHKCAPTDGKGTHFGTDEARLAYVHQALFGAKLYSTCRGNFTRASERQQ